MRTTAQEFERIRDEAWKSEHEDAMECRRCEDLIVRIHDLWDADRQYFASVVPGAAPRDEARRVSTVLRTAEQAMTVILRRAMQSVAKGYTVVGLERLLACLSESRGLIALPIARMMANNDPEGRSAAELAHLLVRHVRFEDGRPVLTEELALQLPCPFEPEPAS